MELNCERKFQDFFFSGVALQKVCDMVCMEQKPKGMDELLKLLEEMGYEVKRGKHISVKGGNQKKFIRFRSLGAGEI